MNQQTTLPVEPPATVMPNGTAKPAGAIVPAVQAPVQIQQTGDSSTIAAFSSQGAFEAAQRMAKALATSTLVPEAYRNNIPNVLIAMELVFCIGVSVFATMQNLDIIHGRPSWRAQFLIATVNGSGRFTPLRFRWQGTKGKDDWGCRAVAKDRESCEECEGALITIELAKSEGWYNRNGSKWKTMPEQILMYRAAAFWTRIYAPELSLGMHTAEEIVDTYGQELPSGPLPDVLAPGSAKALEATLLGKTDTTPPAAPKAADAFDANMDDEADFPEPGSDG